MVVLKAKPNGKDGVDEIDHVATIPPPEVTGHSLTVTSRAKARVLLPPQTGDGRASLMTSVIVVAAPQTPHELQATIEY